MESTSSRFVWIAAALLAAFLLVPQHAIAADADCDGVDDAVDNCPDKFNPTQSNIDGDLVGDRCDSDKDGDALENDADNCPKAANAGQEDADTDGVGDACDQCAVAPGDDSVNRHGCSIAQLCPCDGPELDIQWRNHDQYLRCVRRKARNFQIKGFITRTERRAAIVGARASTCGELEPGQGDNDGDGIIDEVDNCPSDSNPSQRNTDDDAFGDACDSDKDDDGVLNGPDNCPLVVNADGQEADADTDLVGDACDACADSDPADIVDRDGCSIDQLCPCDQDAEGTPWASHTKYQRCVYDEVFRMRLADLLNDEEADAAREHARESSCGERPDVCE